MHILLLSLFYHPEPVARPHELALALLRAGHQVSVVTAYPNYPQGKIYPNYRLRPWLWETLDGVQVLRVPHLIDRSRSAARRLLSYLSFSVTSLCLGIVKIQRPDVIWTYQIGLPGAAMSVLRGVPLVHEVQDLWPEWGNTADLGLKGWLYRLLEQQERMIYRRARVVVTITDSFRSILVQKGVPSDMIEVIPNWVNESVFRPATYDPHLAQKEGFAGYFNVLYVGNIGAAQSLQIVLDAAELLRAASRIRFVIIGDGVERAPLETQARQRGLGNVRFLGSRPQDQAAGYMALADVLFLHLKHDPVYDITIPSKTYGYLAAAKPILAAAEGELADLINKTQSGIVCPPENPTALAEAVMRLADMPEAQRAALGQAGYRAIITDYARATLGKRYADLFERVVAGSLKR
jgi:glycosyltransferase involved in cell wall biosynthesis